MAPDDLNYVATRHSLIDRRVNVEARNFQLKVTLKATIH